jgi:hypothetical protein
MVDRYVYDVVRRLPERERGDVERELRANIRDMLPENPQEAETVHVLESLGEPRKLADQYRANPRYLISPAMFEQYVAAIRIILPVAAVAMGLLGLLFDLAEAGAVSVADAIAGALGNALSAAMSALFFTTMGFALADYYQFKGPARKWSPEDLPDLPPKAAVRIPRGETVAGMVFSVIFIACTFAALKNPQLIGWYEPAKAATPLFTPEALARYVPWFALVSAMSLAVSCVKLILGRWNYPLAAVNTACGLIGAVVFMLFLTGADTFNPAIAAKIQQLFSVPPEQVAWYGRINLTVVSALIAVLTALDVGAGWRKAFKGRRAA